MDNTIVLVFLIFIIITTIGIYIYYEYYDIKPTPTPQVQMRTSSPTLSPTFSPQQLQDILSITYSPQQIQDIQKIYDNMTPITVTIQQISQQIFNSISPSQKDVFERQLITSVQSFQSVYEALIQILHQIPNNELQPLVTDLQYYYQQIIMIYQNIYKISSSDQYKTDIIQYTLQMKQFIDQLPLQDPKNNGQLYEYIKQIPTKIPDTFPKISQSQISLLLPPSKMQIPQLSNELSTQTQSFQDQFLLVIKKIQTNILNIINALPYGFQKVNMQNQLNNFNNQINLFYFETIQMIQNIPKDLINQMEEQFKLLENQYILLYKIFDNIIPSNVSSAQMQQLKNEINLNTSDITFPPNPIQSTSDLKEIINMFPTKIPDFSNLSV